MCGLITVVRTDGKDARKTALKRYEAQKTRGREGFGFVALKEDKMIAFVRTEGEKDIKDALSQKACDILMFHHRMPTSTPNLWECAHPIKVSNAKLTYDYYVAHNGIIWDRETERLRTQHIADGFNYTTEIRFTGEVGERKIPVETKWNDSESLAIELAQDLNKEGNGINIQGSVAFTALEIEKTTDRAVALYWGSNGQSPLHFFEVKDTLITIGSEGAGELIDDNVLYRLDLISGEIDARPYQISDTPTVKTLKASPNDIAFEPVEEGYSDAYFDLVEDQTELQRKRKILEAGGKDTDDIDSQIADLEEELREFEADYDTRMANNLLIG